MAIFWNELQEDVIFCLTLNISSILHCAEICLGCSRIQFYRSDSQRMRRGVSKSNWVQFHKTLLLSLIAKLLTISRMLIIISIKV